ANESFCIVLAEGCNFKEVHSTFGQSAGDAVLQGFASLAAAYLNGQDMVARYGSEGFAMILPDRGLMSAYNLLVKTRHAFKSANHAYADGEPPVDAMTASFGVARFWPGMSARETIAKGRRLSRRRQKRRREIR
ncbi:MAG: diguanylate cyclase, partial [Hyphomonas sp.]|uniref:GGDEF domain-containing protein n=1 Tax=Hyphomonas sp. TaxID=87 RepID=UPI0034A09420